MNVAAMDSTFWDFLDELVATSEVVIDRPKGSQHPRWADLTYPLDAGFLEGTKAPDGSGIDVWVGSISSREVQAVLFSVDLFERDTEYDILLGCTQEEQQTVLEFSNQGRMRVQLIPRIPENLWLLETRRSVRCFLPKPVPGEVLERILQAAAWAPSAHNRQPWRFVILHTQGSKNGLAGAMGASFKEDLLRDGVPLEDALAQVERSRQRITSAPVAILICLDLDEVDEYRDPDRRKAAHLMAVQGVALAGGQILVAAHALGLGGVWMCAPLFAPRKVKEALALPVEWEPQALVLLGYPAKIPQARPRKSLAEICVSR
jgi:F420 biosynthesis protein FbiB-like protein